MERSLSECVLGNYTECLYEGQLPLQAQEPFQMMTNIFIMIQLLFEGVISSGDHSDPKVEDFKTMDLSKLSEHFSFNMDSVLPFFCGDSQDCRTLGSEGRRQIRTKC